MTTRRRFLEAGTVAGAGLLLPWGCGTDTTAEPTALPGTIVPFLDRLPFPAVAQPRGTMEGAPYYEIEAREIRQRLHGSFPATTVWGYGGGYPGPTIVARSGERIFVRWINGLPDRPRHLLDEAYDTHLHGTRAGEPRVRIVTHLHGGHVPPSSDGHPTEWMLPGQSALFEYGNTQRAATLWYHDHVLGVTRLNVYAGLAGFYLIHDDEEDALRLPSGAYEIPIVIQDRSFHPDGRLLYATRDPAEIPTGPQHPGPWVPEMFGDVILVNGVVWPHVEVSARSYRLRILNGSNARFYHLRLGDRSFVQVGSDGGLLAAPVEMRSLLLGPGERADVIVDFSGLSGRDLVLTNDAPDGPFSGTLDPADRADPNTTGQILQFRVRGSAAAAPAIPSLLSTLNRARPADAVRVRDMALEEHLDANGEPTDLEINDMDFDDPAVDRPVLGTTEIWRLINTTGDTHPMHVHLVQFRVLDRQPFAADEYAEQLRQSRRNGTRPPVLEDFLQGEPAPPDDNEQGLKDTVRANPGEVTRILARFDGYRGVYPWHCHILDHEDNSMMVKFEVV